MLVSASWTKTIARRKMGKSRFGRLFKNIFLLVKVVRLGRLERPTSCFGGTRSIQLSYSRVVPLYHARLFARIPGINF